MWTKKDPGQNFLGWIIFMLFAFSSLFIVALLHPDSRAWQEEPHQHVDVAVAEPCQINEELLPSWRYNECIEFYAKKQRLRPELVWAQVQAESGFNPASQSRTGAVGLLQVMSSECPGKDRKDVQTNLDCGTKSLKDLIDRYSGNEEHALWAYVAGPGKVQRMLTDPTALPQVRKYANRILAAAKLRGEQMNKKN